MTFCFCFAGEGVRLRVDFLVVIAEETVGEMRRRGNLRKEGGVYTPSVFAGKAYSGSHDCVYLAGTNI